MDEKGLAAHSADPVSIEDGENSKEEDVDRCCCLSWKPCCPPPTKGCCGLEVEERPDFSVVPPEEKYVLYVPLFFGALAGLSYLVWLSDPVKFAVLAPASEGEGASGGVAQSLQQFMMFPLGLLVWYKGWSAAFTRKIMHVYALIVVPAATIALAVPGQGLLRLIFLSCVWTSLTMNATMAILFNQYTRKWFYWSKICFASMERPGDRPYALVWLMLQATAMTMVQTPMMMWMLSEEKGLLIWIPLFSVGLGDGLAEPVGRMYGKHKYEVRALIGDKKYTRSYEGSATVFVFTLVAVLIGLPEMNWLQALLCIATIPIANTLAEAWSPHTFDNHIMFGVTWFLLWIIFDVIPTE